MCERRHRFSIRAFFLACVIALTLLPPAMAAAPEDWLAWLDSSLFIESSDGRYSADLSGTLDLEAYSIDQLPPGLLFSDDDVLLNPRLSLFLEARLGDHFYLLAQGRFDRGFDPGVDEDGDARADEYLLRYTPWDSGVLKLQVGKFATVFGSWVARHDSWNNPFINAPVPYEHVLTISDQAAPGDPAAFLARKAQPDNKVGWLPILWGPAYTSGGSIFGLYEGFEYAFEIKNASISSRPSVWDATDLGWKYPTVSGRVGYRPNATWRVGSSFSHGPYLLPAADATLPPGTSRGDFNQTTVGTDITYAWRHVQVWAEAMASSFEVPNVGDADTIGYYLEAKYKFTPRLFGALRWNQQFFDTVPDGAGGEQRWDNDLWRAEFALGYRWSRHIQTKLQYGYSHQKGDLQQGEQLVAAQATIKF